MLTKILIIAEIFVLTLCLYRQPTPSLCKDGIDDGKWDPLFLTPYILAGKVKEGRQKALVNFNECGHDSEPDPWSITSYSGFLTVNFTYNSNQFFWYFPPTNKTKDVDAVILWLQGGPGASSLYGLFAENGPWYLIDGWMGSRKVHWAQNYHVIYVDNPVGTGFSFTEDPQGYCRDEMQISHQLLVTMLQFYVLFPELKEHMLIIAGESYAGKYVPALAHAIHMWNSVMEKQEKINLSGLVIGNGLCDPENQLVYDEYLYQLGLLDSNQAKTFHEYQEKIKQHIRAEEWDQAYNILNVLIIGDMLQENTLFKNMTGFDYYYNYLYTKPYHKSGIDKFVGNRAYKMHIHVGNYSFNDGLEVSKNLKEDIPMSVAPLLSELLDHYNVVFYNGQLDLVVPYVSTDNFLRKLNFTGSENLDTAPRLQWMVGAELAGYVKHVGKMVQVLVRDVGHMVPMDKPEWALDLIDRTVRLCARSAANPSLTNKMMNGFLDD